MIADFAADLADADFATPGVQLVRRGAPAYIKGRAVQGSALSTTTALVASIQRPAGKEIDRLPQGQNPEETIIGYTTTPIYVAVTETEQLADHILYAGDEYEVTKVSIWFEAGNYCRFEAVKTKVGA